jgi:glucose-6-phosphate isomerase
MAGALGEAPKGKPPLSSAVTSRSAKAEGLTGAKHRLDYALPSDRLLPYHQDTSRCFADEIGARGLTREQYQAALGATAPVLARLRTDYAKGALRILRLAEAREDLALIERHAQRLRGSFSELVVLGTGGSSLGGQSLVALAEQGFGPLPGAPRLHFLDNIDPERFEALFGSLGLRRTGFLAISKSGATPETVAQFLVCLAGLREAVGEKEAARHFTVVTEPHDNPMRYHAERCGITVLDHDPEVGGRYSALSLVGLLPARVAGVDVAAVREGASLVVRAMLAAKEPQAFAPAVGAAIATALQRDHGVSSTVIMPYVDRLAAFGVWYRQLWAESLGKGGKGMTPARALGTVDQHSQLQLYLDGPADKVFTLVIAAQAGKGRRIPFDFTGDPRLGYLAGRTMGDLLAAEQRATYDTLSAAGRPVLVMAIEAADERTLGALLMHYMLEVIIAADLMGVDPFDQPAVEDGKRRARAYLSERDSE